MKKKQVKIQANRKKAPKVPFWIKYGEKVKRYSRKVIFISCLGLVFSLSFYLTTRIKYSEFFLVSQMEVYGNQRVKSEEIINTLPFGKGDNLFQIDLGTGIDNLQEMNWIKTAEIKKRYPNKIIVVIEEHRAAGVIELDSLYLVDGEGKIFKRVEENEGDGLALIKACTESEFDKQKEICRQLVVKALEIIKSYQEMNLHLFQPISRVIADKLTGYTLEVGKFKTRIHLGLDSKQSTRKKKLDRLSKLLTVLGKKSDKVDYIFLDNQRNPEMVSLAWRK